MSLSKKDIEQLKGHGLTIEKIYHQLKTFSDGIPFVDVLNAASINNGIESISIDDQKKLIEFYDSRKNNLVIIKFVPASGAATRMFQFLFKFLEDYNPNETKLNSYLKKGEYQLLETFINSIKDFAFLNAVRKKIRELYPDFKHGTKGTRIYLLVKTMLEEKGLNFSNLPKGLIPYHKYNKYVTTAFEEHLYETAYYGSVNNNAYLHFKKNMLIFLRKNFKRLKIEFPKKQKRNFIYLIHFRNKKPILSL
jgi:hypothetical protein